MFNIKNLGSGHAFPIGLVLEGAIRLTVRHATTLLHKYESKATAKIKDVEFGDWILKQVKSYIRFCAKVHDSKVISTLGHCNRLNDFL